jgi:predicted Fe-Mo cluster-binding NifX family protein
MTLIAIASDNDLGLKGSVSAHFGRCPYYTLVETDGQQVVTHRVEKNPHFGNHRPGQMPRFIGSLGAHVILAGGMGPKAVDLFHGLGIDVATGVAGEVREAVEAYLQGKLRGVVPCKHDHPDSCGGHGDAPAAPGSSPSSARQAPAPSLAVGPVAIPAADASGLGAMMDSRFGRAPFFIVVDPLTSTILATLPNTAAEAAHGAGTGAAQAMAENGVKVVVAGRFGPKAEQALKALGIQLWTVAEDLSVGQALAKLKAGELSPG